MDTSTKKLSKDNPYYAKIEEEMKKRGARTGEEREKFYKDKVYNNKKNVDVRKDTKEIAPLSGYSHSFDDVKAAPKKDINITDKIKSVSPNSGYAQRFKEDNTNKKAASLSDKIRSVSPVSPAGQKINLNKNPGRLRELQAKKTANDTKKAADEARKFLQADNSVSQYELFNRMNNLTSDDVNRLLQSEEQRNKELKNSRTKLMYDRVGVTADKKKLLDNDLSESNARIQQYRIWLNENDLRQKAEEVKAKYSGLQNEPDYWERSTKAEKKLPYFRSEANDIYEYYVSRFSPETNKYNKYKNINLETDNAGKFLTHATPDEMRNYIYLYNKKGEKAAKEYYDMLEPDLRKRSANAEMEKAEKRGKEHPYISTAETIASYVPVSAVGGAAVAKSALTGKVDPYDPLYVAGAAREAEREATTNLIKNDALRLTYSAVTSAADNAVAALTVGKAVSAFGGAGMSAAAKAAWTGRITGGIMSSGVAANSVLEAKKEGFSDTSALAVGIARGSIEYLSEKFSIERIMKEPTTVLKALRKAVVSEGSEEVVSNWANRLVDNIINMGLTREYNELVASGMSEKEAFLTVAEKAAYEDLESFMGGAIAGGFMTAGHLGVQTAQVGGVKNMNQVLEYQSELSKLTDDERERIIKQNEDRYNKERAVEILTRDNINMGDIAGALNFLGVSDPQQAAKDIERFKETGETSDLMKDKNVSSVVEVLATEGYFKNTDKVNDEVKVVKTSARDVTNVKAIEAPEINVKADPMHGVNEDAVKVITDGIGNEGRKAYYNVLERESESAYQGSEATLLRDFNRFYIKGLNGGKLSEVSGKYAKVMTERSMTEAFKAGQSDRGAMLKEKFKAVNNAVIRDGGLIRNVNSENMTNEEISQIDNLGKKFGVSIEIQDHVYNNSDKEVNGVYEAGSIILNQSKMEEFGNVKAAEGFLVKHELTHRVRELAPKGFETLKSVVYDIEDRKSGNKSKAETVMTQRGVDVDTAIEEIVADHMGNEDFALEVAMKDLSLAERIKGWVSDILDRVGIKKYSETQRIKRLWEKACAEAKRTVKNADKRVGNDVKAADSQKKYSDDDLKVTAEDIQAVQSVGRKSINDFTSEDIKKTESFARKYFKEMGVKSPFFRAWFGDWRANDTTPVKIANVKGAERGVTKNIDTGWDINVSGKVFNETKSHNQKYNLKARPYLEYINSIVENAVLLDSHTISSDKAKSQNSAIMHSLYAIADIGNSKELLKLYVEELNDVNSDGTIKRAYQLQNIESQQMSDRVQEKSLAPSASTADIYTVSQLFNLVKASDKNFSPREASKVVNEDGTPKVVYHGTKEFGFSVFDTAKSDDNSTLFFTDDKDIASTYSGKEGIVRLQDFKNVDYSDKQPYEIAEALNSIKSSDDEFMKQKYSYIDKSAFDKINASIDHNAYALMDYIEGYNFDNEKENIKKTAEKLEEKLNNLDYGSISTPLYMLLHHSSVFSDSKYAKQFAELEKNVRLVNEIEKNGGANVIVGESLDGYSYYIYDIDTAKDILSKKNKMGIYAVHLNMKNPYIVEGNGSNWNDITYYEVIPEDLKRFYKNGLWRHGTTREAAEYAKSEGFDGVIFKNITDNGGNNLNVSNKPVNVYVAFDSNQIKSATDNIGTFDRGNNDIRYSQGDLSEVIKDKTYYKNVEQTYKNDLNKWFETGKLPTRGYFDLGKPSVITSKYLKTNNNFVLQENTLLKATGLKHSISIDEMSKLAEKIQNPLMIFKSDTVNNAYVLFVEMTDKQNAPVIAAVHLNKLKGRTKITNVASIYSKVNDITGKDNMQSFINAQVDKGNFVYANEKSQSWFSTFGLQLPSVVQTFIDSNKIVSQTGENVNTDIKKYSDGDLSDVAVASETTNQGSDIVKKAQSDLDELIKAYGAFDRGEEPRSRDIEIPKKTADDKYTSRYARTAAEANAIGDESAAGIMAAVAEGAYSYSRVSDTQAWKKAEFDIQKSGIEAARERWDGLVKSGKFADKYDIALAEYLLQMAGKNNDTDEVVRLTCEIAAMGTKAGQTVQALRLLKKMDGVSQLQYVERVVDNLQKDLDKRFKNKAPQIEIDEELKKKLAGAKNRDKIDAVTDEILTNIADQMPSTWLDKWNAWRYLAMLGNPRTHIRNIVGNAIFVPAVKIKNSVAYVIESAADKVLKIGGKKGIEKSKSVTTAFASKEYKSFAELDFEAVKDVLTGGGKLNAKSMIEERRSIFKFTPLEKFRVFNDNMLEAEDRLFLKAHYKSALISYLQANKIDVNTLTESNAQGFKTLERARSYAIQEAQKATYRDANSFSNALNVLARSSKPAQYALDALLPFRKTPANILRRGIEYSPAGLISTLTRGVYKVATGNMTATEFIDNLSSGLTGTAIMAVGAMLSSLGFLTGKPRDDEEEFKESIGMQSYALQFHKDGKTHSYTIDWAIPACMPLFVGAEINRLIENDEQMNLSTFFDSLGTVADPIFELSMLDGINNTLSSVSNMGENEKEIPVILREMVTSYFGQGVPTLLGQITRTFADDTRRRTYMDKNSKIPTALQYAAQRQMNKIPGLVKKQEPYVNEWGKADVTENIFERAFENFFSPGYYSVSDENKVNSELIRLSKESTEETPIDVFPKSMPRYFNVDKKRKDLTAKEFTKFQETAGQESFELLQAGFDTDTYKSMTLDERVDFIKTVYDVAKIKGKQAVSDYEPSSDWVKWAIEKGDDAIVNAALFKAKAGEDYFIKIDNMNGFIKSYDAGLDVDGYTQFFLETKGINAKDENGKTVSGLKQKRLIEKLQSMDLTNEERAYYYSTYYENPKNNPWKAYLKN